MYFYNIYKIILKCFKSLLILHIVTKCKYMLFLQHNSCIYYVGYMLFSNHQSKEWLKHLNQCIMTRSNTSLVKCFAKQNTQWQKTCIYTVYNVPHTVRIVKKKAIYKVPHTVRIYKKKCIFTEVKIHEHFELCIFQCELTFIRIIK